MNQQQQFAIEYLREENRVLREQLGGRRVRLNDDQRRWLARVVNESSGSGVELKQAAESVAIANGPALGTERYVWRRDEE
jgi:hypothetical protein